MGIQAYLLCPALKRCIGLGKALRDTDPDTGAERVLDYHIGGPDEPRMWNREVYSKVLWKFLADTKGKELIVKFDYEIEQDMSDEEWGEYIEIGGDELKDISFKRYLEDDRGR